MLDALLVDLIFPSIYRVLEDQSTSFTSFQRLSLTPHILCLKHNDLIGNNAANIITHPFQYKRQACVSDTFSNFSSKKQQQPPLVSCFAFLLTFQP